MFKKFLAMSLSIILAVGCVTVSFAAGESAKVYDIYGDNMLFRQNKDAVISGTAPGGSTITAELFDASGNSVSSGSTVASDGVFSVSFNSPSGGYDEYSVVLKCNGTEFRTLHGVVFGELWLASGQSNMMYPLSQDKNGREMFAKQQPLNENIRILLVPDYPEYKGSKELLPADPQADIIGSQWVTGENGQIYSMSAVAYYFAEKIQKELDMPVGILNVSLGGTALATWLSREMIDGSPEVKNYLWSVGKYIIKSSWKENNQNVYADMTVNFNQRIAALKGFKPSGMIWYQGESDLMSGMSTEYYKNAMELMQSGYAEYFGVDSLPMIYTQLASFPYQNLSEPAMWNIGYAELQARNAGSQAMVTVYDVPIHYIPEAGVIHPETKQPIGERMAFAASGLVYGKRSAFTAATVESTEIKDGSVYVTFKNTGDGLRANGNKLLGFAVCGDNGVYVQADAEIIGKNTVKISSEFVDEPRSASYALCLTNIRSNLYATENGSLALPVSPFVTDKSYNSHFWVDKVWADCEDAQIWHNAQDNTANYYSTWTADGANLEFTDCLNIKATQNNFTVKPVVTFNGVNHFIDMDYNYSDYGKMTLKIRNNGAEDISLDAVCFYTDTAACYSPALEGTSATGRVIPANGEWQTLTFDLSKLYLAGSDGKTAYSNSKLGTVTDIRFTFSGNNADISIDEIRFAPVSETFFSRLIAKIKSDDGFLGFLYDLFIRIADFFKNLF